MNLRPMEMSDAGFLLEMKNYPETRKFSIISKDEIIMENHLEYLKNNLQYFQVIEDLMFGKQDMGVIRIGCIRIEGREISIWINKHFWGEGYATRAIGYVSDHFLVAKIVEGNIASMKCFIRAGFEPVKYIDNYYIFQK